MTETPRILITTITDILYITRKDTPWFEFQTPSLDDAVFTLSASIKGRLSAGKFMINLDLNLIRELLGKKILLTSVSETPLLIQSQ